MIRLFHVSDLHFGAEDPQALHWFADIVAMEQPDLIVVTGDLTQQARPSEFEAAAQGSGRWGSPSLSRSATTTFRYSRWRVS